MANKFTRYLSEFGSGLVEGVTKPKGQMSNYRHATRLFVDNNLRLSPKTKFLYYVQFELENTVRGMSAFTAKHANEAGLLVKSADLPKFNFDSVIKNQYNRKKIVYKQINYEPVNINMHDDSNNVISAMWALYYGYYIGDRHNPNAAYESNHYRPTGTNKDNFRYGLDNDKSVDFFKSVTIYTMSRRRFVGYTLVNPRIKSWSHGGMDYSAGEFNESQMTLEYEAVRYSTGNVSVGTPKGFATLHYDTVPSQLSVAGSSTCGSAQLSVSRAPLIRKYSQKSRNFSPDIENLGVKATTTHRDTFSSLNDNWFCPRTPFPQPNQLIERNKRHRSKKITVIRYPT
jgi:hypothetical protein